jgi:hypothetical protein
MSNSVGNLNKKYWEVADKGLANPAKVSTIKSVIDLCAYYLMKENEFACVDSHKLIPLELNAAKKKKKRRLG